VTARVALALTAGLFLREALAEFLEGQLLGATCLTIALFGCAIAAAGVWSLARTLTDALQTIAHLRSHVGVLRRQLDRAHFLSPRY
jgi:hypothetical protein